MFPFDFYSTSGVNFRFRLVVAHLHLLVMVSLAVGIGASVLQTDAHYSLSTDFI